MLSGLKDSLSKGRTSLGKRMFKRGGKDKGGGAPGGASPRKDTLQTTVHVSERLLGEGGHPQGGGP